MKNFISRWTSKLLVWLTMHGLQLRTFNSCLFPLLYNYFFLFLKFFFQMVFSTSSAACLEPRVIWARANRIKRILFFQNERVKKSITFCSLSLFRYILNFYFLFFLLFSWFFIMPYSFFATFISQGNLMGDRWLLVILLCVQHSSIFFSFILFFFFKCICNHIRHELHNK